MYVCVYIEISGDKSAHEDLRMRLWGREADQVSRKTEKTRLEFPVDEQSFRTETLKRQQAIALLHPPTCSIAQRNVHKS